MCHVAISIIATCALVTPSTTPELPASLDYDTLRGIPLQHDGRYPPLDTVARDLVEQVTGDSFYLNHDPIALLLAWTFVPELWSSAPLVEIKNSELRAELKLPAAQTVYSYNELISHKHLRTLIRNLGQMGEDRKPDPLESKVGDINAKLGTLQDIFRGHVITPIPDPQNAHGRWHPIHAPAASGGHDHGNVHAEWTALKSAFTNNDAPAFAAASRRFADSLAALPAAYRPDSARIATELRSNRLRPFRTAWIVMLIGAALSAVAVFVKRRWCDALAVVGMISGFCLLTYGLSLRWTIAGRIPAANMFESLLFVSWGMGAFAIFAMFVVRQRSVPLTASGMGAAALILADCLPIDSFVRPIAPVLLDTVWMSIHVPIIMVSYSVLTLAVLIAHAQLVTMAIAPRRASTIRSIDATLYWYIHVGSLLLLVGIITGSMWAASSWGRYWGWDPKEVWSLVAFLAYMAILHVRINHERVPKWVYAVGGLLTVTLFVIVAPKMAPMTNTKILGLTASAMAVVLFVFSRGPLAAAIKTILAFWLIIMTYVGVNYVLGTGLHSYGFGTGAVARYMFLTGGADLAFAGFWTVIYFIRTRDGFQPPASRGFSLPVAN